MPLVGSELPQAPSGYLRTVLYNDSNNCVPHIKAHSPSATRENARCPPLSYPACHNGSAILFHFLDPQCKLQSKRLSTKAWGHVHKGKEASWLINAGNTEIN